MEINRQYIGARYVPKFADPIEWDNLRSYEGMTIVTYLGTSYTSKKPVPVGIELSDTEYWVVTGNYNEQVEHYRQEVEGYNQTVEEYKLEVEDCENDINALSEKVNGKFVIMADSYGNFDFNGNHYSWTEYVINKLGLDAVNLSVGNRGFVYNPVVGTFLSGLQEAVNNHVIADPTLITDIIVGAGANDMAGITLAGVTKQNIIDAISAFCAYCKTTFPNAKVGIAMIGSTLGNSGPYYTSFYETLEAYKTVINHGGYYIENSECILMDRSLISSDGVHPTPTGFDWLGKHMVNGVRFGRVDVTREDQTLLATPLTCSIGSWNIAPETHITQHNGNIRLTIKQLGGAFTFTNDDTLDNISSLIQYATVTKLLPFMKFSNGSLLCSDIADGKAVNLGKVGASLMSTTGSILHLELNLFACGDGLYLGLPNGNNFLELYGSSMYNDLTAQNVLTLHPYILSIAPSCITIDQSVNNQI